MTINWLLLRKNLWNMIFFTLQHYPSSWNQQSAFSGLKIFQKQLLFAILWTKPEKNRYFILPQKSVKPTIRRQLRKTLIELCGSLELAILLMAGMDDTEWKQLCYVWVALSFFSYIPALVIHAAVVKILSDFWDLKMQHARDYRAKVWTTSKTLQSKISCQN